MQNKTNQGLELVIIPVIIIDTAHEDFNNNGWSFVSPDVCTWSVLLVSSRRQALATVRVSPAYSHET